MLEVLASAPDEVKASEFVGIFQHAPTSLGVIVKQKTGGPNILWNWFEFDDPPWAPLDERQVPTE
jgi:hypothetical protein